VKATVEILEERISSAMSKATGLADCVAMVKVAADTKFGDYQANGVMALARKVKRQPRELAAEVVEKADVKDICKPPEIAGPGFINFRLKPAYLSEKLLEINTDAQNRLGVQPTFEPKKTVVDFSGPNIAKQMHVGHLRSTIIGDCICRLLEFLGNEVIRQNHLGDWGTQFGMLIAYLRQTNPEVVDSPDKVRIEDLEEFYRSAQQLDETDEDFAAKARREVINLHNRQTDTIRIWEHIIEESRRHYQQVYDELGVNLHSDNERGESFYADRLGDIVEDLRKKGLAEESDGAICVFPEGFKNKQGNPLPLIVQKSDGAYLYATTDLAALRYRLNELGAERIIYVTDARQSLHFQMVFAVARQAGWVKDDVELSHITFGSVLGEDGKPFKTRAGKSVKLRDLLSEAVERAKEIVEEKNPDVDKDRRKQIAAAVGIGAVKYADYSNSRTSDYVFSFDKMLSMEGNTAPYMQYAYARIKSIERKSVSREVDIKSELSGLKKLSLTEEAELDLAKALIRYGEAVAAAAKDYKPNYLTNYLYELSQKFSVFYTNCPVLTADKATRPTRLLLCCVTGKTIKDGLDRLLGIRVVEQM